MTYFVNGCTKLNYDTNLFNFKALIFEELNEFIKKHENLSIKSLSDLHKIDSITKDVEPYRQKCFSIFRSEKFQTLYRMFALDLIKNYFNEDSLFQKTPTVRIQFPGEKATPYHSDGWYGHGDSVKSFWVPMTSVDSNNTLYMAKDKKSSKLFLKKIISDSPPYKKISSLAKKICEPLNGGVGDVFVFSSDMIHGTEMAVGNNTRLSFDFRIAEDPKKLGNKPRSNFYSKEEVNSAKKNEENNLKRTGLFYTNNCNNKPSKSQIMLCQTFCAENKIKILGGDSEILPLEYLPVLRHYLTDKSLKINCVVVFGLEIFNSSKELAKEILNIALDNKIEIIFCSENIFFNNKKQIKNLINIL